MTPERLPICTSLPALLQGVTDNVPAIDVRALCIDSRLVGEGDLFIALRGQSHDGRAYLRQAAESGAAAALVEDELPAIETSLPLIVVPGLRQRLGSIASRFYGEPSRGMHVAAVTGTNGKTTVSQLFAQLVRSAGYDCGVIGTLGASLDGRPQVSLHTTPDPISLQRMLADWSAQAVPFVSMEASSHALDQGRLNGVDVDTAVFTNLTRDHLDYHGDMAAYGNAKARLFDFSSLRAAVLNADDAFSVALARDMAPNISLLSYSMQDVSADVRLRNLELGAAGMRLRFESPWGSATLKCPLLGAFNAMNLLAALTAALQSGLPFDRLIKAVESLQAVPGRMEPLRAPGAPLVVVDYAHTPDALRQVLAALRAQCDGHLVVVFGCGGDRDRGKRPLMAEVVSAAADSAVLTNDNPRSEDPLAIIADIEASMTGQYSVRPDRAEAIMLAIESVSSDDCVLIAGKGHEDYQIVGDERLAFSDIEVAGHALARLAA